MIPFNPVQLVRDFNRRSVLATVTKAMRDWDMHSPILLATVPNAADYLGQLGERMTVYYCVDDFSIWPGMNLPVMVRGMEETLLAGSDLVITVSAELQATRRGRNGETRLLTHGVDVEHFRQASCPQPRPEGLANISGPILGFYGLIDQHLDVNIVRALLDQRPDWTVVLIGVKRIDLGALEAKTNFRWFPSVPYSDLPRYASAFDVAIIPYVLNQHTHAANPLKFKEYLATGKPVVTTPMAEVLPFANLVHLANGPAEFVQAAEQALTETVRMDERMARLKGETWRDKANLMATWIEEELSTSGRSCGLQA
jgi:glycosyltransferase involved in cell wall biosynthesis